MLASLGECNRFGLLGTGDGFATRELELSRVILAHHDRDLVLGAALSSARGAGFFSRHDSETVS